MAQETLVVKVVPDDAPAPDPSTAPSPDRARFSSDLPVLGKSPTFPRRPLPPRPDRHRSLRSDSSLGAASDLMWADDDDDDEEEAAWSGHASGQVSETRGGADHKRLSASKQRSSRKRPERAGWWTAHKKTRNVIRRRVTRFLDAAAPQTFLFLVLLVALFLTDAVAFVSAPDAVDTPVAWTMLGALVVFSAELVLNCACRDDYPWSFYFWMDALGTFSLVADVPFLSKGWLPDGAEIGTTLRVSRAAKFGARASKDGARLVRFVRSVATLRLLRPLTSNLRDSRGIRGENSHSRKTSTGKIAADLDESMSKSVAVVVLLTILAAPLLLWDDSDTIPAAYHSSLAAVSSDDVTPSARVADAVAGGFFEFFSESERKPVSLAFAGNVWRWTETYPRSERSNDRLVIRSGDCGAEAFAPPTDASANEIEIDVSSSANASISSPCVALELDIALVNKWTAMLNIGMVVFVIVELVLVSALLTMVTTKLVVTPLERIFGNIKKNMDALFVTFGPSSGGESRPSSRRASADGKERSPPDSDGLDAMEAAIDKMARLVRHVAGSNAQGAHMFREYVDDENVDENTRAWLMDMNAGVEGKTPKKDGFHPSRSKAVLTPSKSMGARVFERSLTPPRNTPGGSPMDTRKPSLSSRPSLGTPPRSSPAISRRGSRALAPVSLTRSFDAAAQGAGVVTNDKARQKGLGTTRDDATESPGPKNAFLGTKKTLRGGLDDDVSDQNGSVARRRSARFPSFENARRACGDADVAGRSFDFEGGEYLEDEFDNDIDFLDDQGAPVKAGPELQLRQARARARARAQGAAAAVASARASGVQLPDTLDHRLIDAWAFDVLLMSSEEARAYVLMMFGSLGLLRLHDEELAKASLDAETAASEGFCAPKTVWNFLERLEGGYRRNAYHNFQHAVDVTHTVYRYVVLTEPRTHVTQTEKFSLMIAALAHDLDHPGVSNAFLVNTRDPLATVYNDSSVLENAHVAALYNLIRTRQMRDGVLENETSDANAPDAEDDANVFALLDDDLYRETRALIIAAVLHTDMSHHFKMVSQMEVFYELHSEGIKANTRRVRRGIMVDCIYQKEDDRRFILCVLLHAADIGNPVKPLKTYGKWANRVLSEFFTQGDLEKTRNMPVSAMMDCTTTNAAMSQINFMEFVVAPLYANFTKLFPEARELIGHLIENRVHFQRALERELDGEETSDETATSLCATSSVSSVTNRGVNDAESRFAESGGFRAARAGEGKSFSEREADKHATRARFKALVEKHDFKARLLLSDDKEPTDSAAFAERSAFDVLMRDAPRNVNVRLARLPPSPRAEEVCDTEPPRLAGFVPDASPGSSATARRTLLAAAAAGVRDVALNVGASAKKLRRPSGKADGLGARSPQRAT